MSPEKCEKIDHLFEIGLVLSTVVSASELQFVSLKSPNEMDFAFKALTIPIIVLILLWLMKDLITIDFTKYLLFKKRFMKEFCWTFLSNFLVLIDRSKATEPYEQQ